METFYCRIIDSIRNSSQFPSDSNLHFSIIDLCNKCEYRFV